MNIRLPKLLAAAEGRPCTNCGVRDDTVVRAHYTGLRQHIYGKGKGIKGHDHIAADLCGKCHRTFDQYKQPLSSKIDMSEQFLHCVVMTLTRDIEEGILRGD